jgi:putative sterol carrier protein
LISLIDIKPNVSRYAPQARSLTIKLIDKFNPDAVRDWESTIGLNVLPEKNVPELKFSLTIKKGKATLEEGSLPDKAVLVLSIPAGTWAAILLGKEKIEKAFMEGRITIEGEAEEALKLRSAFGI